VEQVAGQVLGDDGVLDCGLLFLGWFFHGLVVVTPVFFWPRSGRTSSPRRRGSHFFAGVRVDACTKWGSRLRGNDVMSTDHATLVFL
jgi:hypothetical protein